MGIFDNIMSAIFGRAKADTPAPQTAGGAAGSAAPGAPQEGAASSAAPVDVDAVLTEAAAQKKEKLNWKTSIVDLMKVLDLDSGLGARKELAKELGYTGDTGDSAKMNIWLHKQVMNKLAQNGGKVPAELRD